MRAARDVRDTEYYVLLEHVRWHSSPLLICEFIWIAFSSRSQVVSLLHISILTLSNYLVDRKNYYYVFTGWWTWWITFRMTASVESVWARTGAGSIDLQRPWGSACRAGSLGVNNNMYTLWVDSTGVDAMLFYHGDYHTEYSVFNCPVNN